MMLPVHCFCGANRKMWLFPYRFPSPDPEDISLALQARVRQGDPMAAEYLLDVLGDKPVLALPTHRRDAAADDVQQARQALGGGGALGGRQDQSGMLEIIGGLPPRSQI